MEGLTSAAMLFHGILTPSALHSDWIDRSSFLSISSRKESVKFMDIYGSLELHRVLHTGPANKITFGCTRCALFSHVPR